MIQLMMKIQMTKKYKQFNKITRTGKNLLGALNGDLSNSEFNQLMEILDNNGLLGSTIYTNDGASGYKKMYAIASAAK